MKVESSRVESSQAKPSQIKEKAKKTHTMAKKDSYLIFFIFRRTHSTALSMYTHIMLHIIVSRSDEDYDDNNDSNDDGKDDNVNNYNK